ncbi:carbon-nitrogen hydrolase family protein [Pseudonocardia sp. D17]|uniref:carbon-nitrogen hydrolase family protein n=1 Tax=Pseudonocardia sp. D17 TaxID=882661 RepID=UPI002B3C7070|nr:hydrolase [Pseudonocardia sp. D17]
MTSPPTRVAAAQFAPSRDTDANLDRIARFAKQASTAGAHVLVLPEYSSWFAPVLGEAFLAGAQPLDGSFVRSLTALAAEHDLLLVAGMVEAATGPDDPRVSNTLVATDGHGVRAVYRKIHLYDAFGSRESDWMRPGGIEAPETLALGDLTLGLQTCYDLRFPEVSRYLVDAGADLLAVPAEWVAGPNKLDHWTTLCRARAIENTCFVVAADHVPPVGVGASMIVDPLGGVLAHAGEEEGMIVADVDPAVLTAVRTTNPALRLRRFTVAPG